MKFWLGVMVICLLLPSAVFGQVFSNTSPKVPKLANFFLAPKLKTTDVAALAKWDLVILPMDYQVLYGAELRELRRRNPNIILLAYVTSQETFTDFSGLKDLFPMRYRLFQGIQNSWFVTAPDGTKKSFWPGTNLLNVTPECPKVNGKNWTEYLADFMTREVLSSGLWDGVFYDNAWDNISYFASGPLDLNRDGIPDAAPDVRWQAGMTNLFTLTRGLMSKPILLVGNNDTPAYTKELNGMLLENYDTKRFVDLYKRAEANARLRRDPKINVINSNTGNSGNQFDYRAMRLGFTSALLTDSYFSFDFGDKNHGQIWWYDEYGIDLGSASADASLVSGQQAVWQREFARGAAIVNGTPATVRVKLGAEYEKLTGTQDRVVNTGAVVEDVAVPPNDGVVLLKPLKRLDEVVYPNGWFARFVNAKGERIRNGFFTFDEKMKGGQRVLRTDMNGDGVADIVVTNGAKLSITEQSGQLFMEVFPYTANYKGELRFAVLDSDGDGQKEVVVVPGPSIAAPVKIYSLYGDLLATDIYPFGKGWTGGLSVATGVLEGGSSQQIIVSGGSPRGMVKIYTSSLKQLREWVPFTESVLSLALGVGDVVGEAGDEVVVAGVTSNRAILGVFSALGKRLLPEVVPVAKRPSALEVGVTDVDFDGHDDIILLTRNPNM